LFLSGSEGDIQAQWPRSLRRVSLAACMMGLRVRILLGAWISVS